MKKILWILLGALFPLWVSASDVEDSRIVEVRSGPWYGTVVVFKVEPAPKSQPACSNLNNRGHYVFDVSNPGGSQWLSMVLAAHASGKSVQIWGSDKCIDIHSGSSAGEELETIAIK